MMTQKHDYKSALEATEKLDSFIADETSTDDGILMAVDSYYANYGETIRHALETMSNAGWQDISTAPKDGTEIRLALTLNWPQESLDEEQPKIGTGFYDFGAGWYVKETKIWRNRLDQFFRSPTHWAPLTPPPSEKEEGDE